MMTVFVTGATGFIGNYVVEELLSSGFKVVGFDLREALKPKSNEFYKEYIGSITDAEFVESVFRENKIHGVIHLAAIPSIAKGTEQLYTSVNLGGTNLITKLAKQYGVKTVVYSSSSTVYGKPKVLPISELADTPPIGKYGQTKLAAEQAVLDLNKNGMKGVVIRPRVVMGPGRMGIFDLLFNAIYWSKSVPIVGSGKNRFQFTDVRDLSFVMVQFLSRGQGGIYNVGCDTELNVAQLLSQTIKNAGSKSKVIKTPALPIKLLLTALNKLGISPLMEEQYNIANLDFVLNTSKVKEELDWKPRYNDVTCLTNAYKWWVSEKKYADRQFQEKFGLLGKFKNSHQSGFQKGN